METKWVCTSCMWEGTYKQTESVMYKGVGWQYCPSCGEPVIPKKVDQKEEETKEYEPHKSEVDIAPDEGQ